LRQAGAGLRRRICSSAQLFLVDRVRRAGHQAVGTLGLGEGDDVADRLGTAHQGDETVETEGEATVRRRAIFQRIEQEAELVLTLCLADVERGEHLLLNLLTVDPNGAATDFPAV